jgi:ribosomal-protein-alanine N-acetyltransferase
MTGKSMIREATPQDLDALLDMEQAAFNRDAFRLGQLRYLLTRAKATTFILEDDGRILGSAVMLWRKNSRSGRLYSIAIYPAFQGQGWGSQLLQACEAAAIRRGCASLSLEVRADNQQAIVFYQRRGYQISKSLPGYYSDGTSGLRMVKQLTKEEGRRTKVSSPPSSSVLRPSSV